MTIDLSLVVGREDLAQQLRVLKAASGRSNTQVAADSGLSTSGIEGMLAGANLPNEDTVRRFVQACGAEPRPWVAARNRVAAAQPKTLRLPQEIREEFEILRARNSALTDALAAAGERASELEERVSALEAAARPAGVEGWELARLRLAPLLPTFIHTEGVRIWTQAQERRPLRYKAPPIVEALTDIRSLLLKDGPAELLSYLTAMAPFPWEGPQQSSTAAGGLEGEGGFLIAEVDQFFALFRSRVYQEVQALR